MRVQWMQSWMSVALRRMCVEPVNWYFLSDSEKSWRWQKKKKILRVSVYEEVQICQGAPFHKPNNRATERRAKEDSKTPMTTL